MPFSQDKLDQVKAGVDRALSSGRLNDWETRFLSDMRDRLNQHGRGTTLSDKQYRKLMQLAGVARTADGTRPKKPAHKKNPQENVVDLSAAKGAKARTKKHRPKPQRHSYRRSRRFGLRRAEKYAVLLAFGAILTVFNLFSPGQDTEVQPTTSAAPVALTGSSIEVIDGDTVRVPGESRRIRLVGFNAPEVFSPQCNRERQLGEQATHRLGQLLRNAEQVEFERVRCACPPGTEGTERCNFGRLCGTIEADGVDVGRTLIDEGLAARYRCGSNSCPRPTGNWCD